MSSKIPQEKLASQLSSVGYIPDRDLSIALWMMEKLSRPLLLEGDAGVGKTEVAKALALSNNTKLIRLQSMKVLIRMQLSMNGTTSVNCLQ